MVHLLTIIFFARFKIGHTPRKNRLFKPQPPASTHICCSHARCIITQSGAYNNEMGEFFYLEVLENLKIFFVHFSQSVQCTQQHCKNRQKHKRRNYNRYNSYKYCALICLFLLFIGIFIVHRKNPFFNLCLPI